MTNMFGRVYKTRFIFACVILIALTCLIRNSFFAGSNGLMDTSRVIIDDVVAESTVFSKPEFSRMIAMVDACPVCFGQDMCKDLAKKELEISR